jgi:DNA-binding transcriptional LysR family regulator
VPTAAQFVLPAVAGQLAARGPAVTLRTVVGLSTRSGRCCSREIDMMVGTQVATEAGYESKLLAVDAIVVAASANHAVFQEDRPTLKSLTGYRWALQPPGAPRATGSTTRSTASIFPAQVQVETTMLLMLPTLIEQTGC